MKFTTWLSRRRISRTISDTPIYMLTAEDLRLNPHGGVPNLLEPHEDWPTNEVAS